MIVVGIAIGNINNGHLVKGLPASWSKELRAIALAIIFLRSGLELDLRVESMEPVMRLHMSATASTTFLCGTVTHARVVLHRTMQPSSVPCK